MKNIKKTKLHLITCAVILAAVAVALVYFFVIPKNSTPAPQATTKTCTTYNNTVQEQCIEDYIGLTKEGAIARAKKYGYTPVVIDNPTGQFLIDRADRTPIYLVVKNGAVVKGYFLSQ